MPRITRLSAQKKHPHRYNCFLDNDERITITDDMIIRFHLASGSELSDAELQRLRNEADRVFTREKALELLSLRDHAAGELRTKLLQKGYKKEHIPGVIRELQEKKYINDSRFADMYAAELIDKKHEGPAKVKERLIRRGVPAETIRGIMADYDDARQIANCRYHYEKKFPTLRGGDPVSDKQKMIRFLQGKGFGWQVISAVLEEDYEE
ncbi:MAG: RecX family transcriptional regulator [FCB group bacterium]|nr:RecX family transcriptional regulator [FCB group bacterium]